MTKNEDTPQLSGALLRERQCLLAQVAGHVASGLITAPSPKVSSSEKIATVAVDIAEAILQKVGL